MAAQRNGRAGRRPLPLHLRVSGDDAGAGLHQRVDDERQIRNHARLHRDRDAVPGRTAVQGAGRVEQEDLVVAAGQIDEQIRARHVHDLLGRVADDDVRSRKRIARSGDEPLQASVRGNDHVPQIARVGLSGDRGEHDVLDQQRGGEDAVAVDVPENAEGVRARREPVEVEAAVLVRLDRELAAEDIDPGVGGGGGRTVRVLDDQPAAEFSGFELAVVREATGLRGQQCAQKDRKPAVPN